MRRSGGAQFLFSRITGLLILTIGILVSQTAAKPQSDNDQLEGIPTEHFNTAEGRESIPRETTTPFSHTTSSPLKRVTREVQNSYTDTPGVGRHKIHSNAATWHEARKICQKEGGDLAVVNSKTESQTLAKLIAKSYPHYDSYNSYFVSIGFDDLDEEGKYVTIDGKSLKEAGFAEWFWRQPDNSQQWGGENCGSIHKGGRLNDVPCHKKFAFACELPLVDEESFPRDTSTSFSNATSSLSKNVTQGVQNNYTHTPGVGIHKIHTRAKKWHDARKICQAEGGDLAIINSKAESRALVKLIAKSSYIYYGSIQPLVVLIGFNDIDEEDKFVTIDGKSLKEAGFEEWSLGQPDNNPQWGGEDCGSVYLNGTLNDVSCDTEYAFACELPILDQAGPKEIPGEPAKKLPEKKDPGIANVSTSEAFKPGFPPNGSDGLQGVACGNGTKPPGECGLGFDATCLMLLLDVRRGRNQSLDLLIKNATATLSGTNVTEQAQKEIMKRLCEQLKTSVNPADGRKESPAKGCRDLFLTYPDKPSGEYWIDPNEGDTSDKILVRCDVEKNATCITPENNESKIITNTSDPEAWLSELERGMNITYGATSSQISALQTMSSHAEQTVTYNCLKSVGYFDAESGTYDRGLQLLAWTGVTLNPRGNPNLRYEMVSDQCQDRSIDWKETKIVFRTDRPVLLPVVDVALRDVDHSGKSGDVIIGEVCFKWA